MMMKFKASLELARIKNTQVNITLKGNCMNPVLEEGDTLLINPNTDDLKVDKIILFERDEKMFAHRVYRMDYPSKDYIQTKADSYIFPDDPIHKNQIFGYVEKAFDCRFNKPKDISYLDLKQLAIEKSSTHNEHCVLDAGCGAGAMSSSLIKNGLEVVSIDHCIDSLGVARESLSKLNFLDHAELFCSDINVFKYPKKFDRIFLYHTLHHLQDPKGDLKSLIEKSSDKGKIVIIDFKTSYLNMVHNLTKKLYEKGEMSLGPHPVGEITVDETVSFLNEFCKDVSYEVYQNEVLIIASL